MSAGLAGLSAWRGRRVVITGSTGFKGAWLAFALAEAGAHVVGVALPEATAPSLFQLLGLRERIDQRFGDLAAPGTAVAALDEAPDVVFHLAAQAIVRAAHADPIGTYATNLMGTVRLLEAVRAEPSVRVVVIATTDKVYADESGLAQAEGAALGGADPYSASKACAELAVGQARATWAAARGLGLATARAGNTLGGGDWAADRLVPDCVRAAQAGTQVTLRNPSAVRPWLHVLDVLDGYVRVADALLDGAAGEAWNLGPLGEDLTVRQVAEAVMGALGRADGVMVGEAGGPPEQHALRIDAGAARARLGWGPKLGARDALAGTARWYAGWAEGLDAADLCRGDLAAWRAR